jgi:hypothetical protein
LPIAEASRVNAATDGSAVPSSSRVNNDRDGPFPVRWTRAEGRPILRETQEWARHAADIPKSTRLTR